MTTSIDTTAHKHRMQAIKRVLWVILFLNVAVAVAKYAYGVASGSASMEADGLHSLFDGTSNVIGLIGISLAARPADYDHPYGHSKYETYASAVIGVMLLFAAWRVGSTAIANLVGQNHMARVDIGSFAVMLFTLCINVAVTTWEHRRGKRLGSEILIADAKHTLSDVYVSASVIVGLIFVRLGFPIADSIAALVVCIAILHTAYEVFKQANATLSDSARIPNDEIKNIAMSRPGVLGCHKIRTRGSSAEVYADLHVLVDGSATVNRGHQIGEEVSDALKKAFPQIVDVVVHVEPFDEKQKSISDEEAQELTDEQAQAKAEKLKRQMEKGE